LTDFHNFFTAHSSKHFRRASGKQLLHVLCSICSETETAPHAVLNVRRDSSCSTAVPCTPWTPRQLLYVS